MQFSVIRTYCATRFRDTGLAVVTDADWKNYVNSAYGNVLMALPFYPWNELSTTITINAGVRTGALPLDAWQVLSVWDSTDQYPMVPLEGRNQVYQEYPQQNEIGTPQHYRIFNNQLQVYPLPQANTAFIVEYMKMPADLVADGDLPVFPDAFHDILVVGAVQMAYSDDGNQQQAQAYQAEYSDMLKSLKTWISQPRQDRFYEPVDTFM